MSGWTLGIDFGTSYTVAAVGENGQARAVDIESSGRDRMPSAVFLAEDGQLLVGTAAQHQSKFAPERYEPTPKRTMGEGEIFLGDRLIGVVDLVAAILRRTYAEASRQQGELAPDLVRLTHPADWAQPRCQVLLEACSKASIPEPELVPEPVAAAVRIALKSTPPDRHIAVYDFGGGTFDAAVLLRTAEGFEVAGPPSGRDPLGGEDLDRRIIEYLGEFLEPDHPGEWHSLLEPPDVEWRGYRIELGAEVQRAKETLSDVEAAQLWIPGIRRDVQLTRDELNELIDADVNATIETLEVALQDAGVTANDLAGLYLVGGSSRIPLVADRLWRRLGVQPSVQDDPKLVVAMGAAGWIHRPSGSGSQPQGGFKARLAGRLGAGGSPSTTWAAQIVLDRPHGSPLTLRVRDDPAPSATTEQVAEAARARRASQTPGFTDQELVPAKVLGSEGGLERRFSMTVQGSPMMMFEQYVVLGGRALVLISPESGRSVAETVELGEPNAAGELAGARFRLIAPPDWMVSEQLTLWGPEGPGSVVARRALLASESAQAWRQAELARLDRLPDLRIVGRAQARLMGDVPGEVVTALWRSDRQLMVSKLGVGDHEGEGLSLLIALAAEDQARFAELARSVSLVPELS